MSFTKERQKKNIKVEVEDSSETCYDGSGTVAELEVEFSDLSTRQSLNVPVLRKFFCLADHTDNV